MVEINGVLCAMRPLSVIRAVETSRGAATDRRTAQVDFWGTFALNRTVENARVKLPRRRPDLIQPLASIEATCLITFHVGGK
jgi:hypothetical protein